MAFFVGRRRRLGCEARRARSAPGSLRRQDAGGTAPQALALARRARERARDGPNHSRRMETGHPSGGLFCGSAEATGLRSPARAQRAAGSLRRQDAGADSAAGAGPRAPREGEGQGWPEPFPPPAKSQTASRWPFFGLVKAVGLRSERARSAPGSLRRQDAGADSAAGAGPCAQREGEGQGWPEPFLPHGNGPP